jgi:hypothetical protein
MKMLNASLPPYMEKLMRIIISLLLCLCAFPAVYAQLA